MTSQEEMDFVINQVQYQRESWIGGSRDDQGNWSWVTGEPWEFTNFYQQHHFDELSNYLRVERDGFWYPDYKTNNRDFIIEWDADKSDLA